MVHTTNISCLGLRLGDGGPTSRYQQDRFLVRSVRRLCSSLFAWLVKGYSPVSPHTAFSISMKNTTHAIFLTGTHKAFGYYNITLLPSPKLMLRNHTIQSFSCQAYKQTKTNNNRQKASKQANKHSFQCFV